MAKALYLSKTCNNNDQFGSSHLYSIMNIASLNIFLMTLMWIVCEYDEVRANPVPKVKKQGTIILQCTQCSTNQNMNRNCPPQNLNRCIPTQSAWMMRPQMRNGVQNTNRCRPTMRQTSNGCCPNQPFLHQRPPQPPCPTFPSTMCPPTTQNQFWSNMQCRSPARNQNRCVTRTSKSF